MDRLAQPGKAWTRATLQATTGVNYDIFRRYLEFLEARGFVEVVRVAGRGGPGDEEGGRDLYRLSTAGRAAHDRVLGLVKEFLADPPVPAGAAPRGNPAQARPGPAPT